MASVPIIVIFLFLFLSIESKLSTANINVNSSLTTTEKASWTSPSGDFAFGFRRLDNSNHFLLAIWFNKIPDRTIVWYAKGDSPVPSGSKVELTANSLVLTDPEGLIIWEANPAATISSAEMLDTGNFALSGNGSTYLWESFRNPADTILPSQILNLGDQLFSRLTETNYSRGRYVLQFQNGSLSLHPTAWPSDTIYYSYFDSGTFNVNPLESGYQLVFNRSGAIYITSMSGDVLQIPNWNSMNYSKDFYYRATFDFDGVFTQYLHPKSSGSGSRDWQAIQSIPEDMCTVMFTDIGSGPCGFNSYCTLRNSRPSCDCPPGYVFTDPTNRFAGCIPTYPQGCGLGDDSRKPEDLYEFREFDNVDFPMNNYEMLSPYNQSQCEDACLRDCDCAVSILEGNKCWKKRLPLSMGRYWTRTYFKMLFKVRKQVPPPGFSVSDGKKEKPILLEILLGVSALIIVLLSVIILLYLLKKRQRESQRKSQKNAQDPSSYEINLRLFTYKELEEATDGFKEELGRGSFGIVYKGALEFGSRNEVAVKKLDKLAQDREREFRTEVKTIGNTHHKNLVKLLGYCDEGAHRLLIYEFMSNGTLADFLFDLPRPDWEQRVKIALGIARGLLYLHEECDVPIIHCDIKPQNILLDDYLTAKISDFGLAKLLLSNQTRTRTMIRGTRGYVAPEWFKNVPITAKIDVYSFGVMLLEIICCRRSVVMELEEVERAILTDWAYDCFISGRFDLLVENDGVAMSDKSKLEKWVKIAIWCIQEGPSKRPTMKMVMEMLEGFLDVPLPPCPSVLGPTFEC